MATSVFPHCATYANAIQTRFASLVPGREEDQLRRPVDDLLEAIGKAHGFTILAKDESPLAQVGRPDFAIAVNRLLCGYVELKAPGSGTDPRRFKGHNRQQWERFRHLPNLIYTDGNEWALFRSGEAIRRVRFLDDITLAGAHGVDEATAYHHATTGRLSAKADDQWSDWMSDLRPDPGLCDPNASQSWPYRCFCQGLRS